MCAVVPDSQSGSCQAEEASIKLRKRGRKENPGKTEVMLLGKRESFPTKRSLRS